MDILSLLVPTVGSSVAKLLLKKYLASSEVAQLFGEELTKLAVAGLKSKLEQRQAIRVFEDLADKIVNQLTPLFEEAGRRGNLNTEAVAKELGATLEGRISPDLLLSSDMAPDKLVRALRDSRPLPPNQLTEADAELYARALDQTARYLVATATLLPHFVERLAVTQLQRISRMEGEISRTHASVRLIEEQVSTLSPDKTFARFEADYRQSVSLTVDTLELFGVDVDPQSTQYKLSVAYISLSLLEESSNEESSNEEESTLVPAEHLLQQLRPGAGRLLIRGDAGSGKSTLFRWMALTVAQGERKGAEHLRSRSPEETDRVTLWSRCVPFLIRLRDCRDGKLPSIDDFTGQVAPELGSPPPNWMSSILEAGRALVLLDGVDEVPNRNRDDVYKSVERLIRKYPGCYFLLSTRPAAVERGWLKPLGFREADVSPLSDVDRDQLIGRWHVAVEHELSLRGQPGAGLGQLAENLKRGLRENPPIARLATNPLLAAMICALHRDRSQRLPESLADLCEALCHMLLHRRERESNLKLEDFPEEYRTLSYRQKRDIVAELAVHMARNEVSTLDREEAIIKAGEVLDTTPGHQMNEASVVLNGLIERSGMLREARPGAVDFIHNTFKEYLAGELFGQQRDYEFLAKRALDPAWQNILLFAAATGESTFVRNLLNRILGLQPGQEPPVETPRKPKVSAEERMRRLMAVRLRSVVQRLDKSLEARIDALRSALFPPATMADAAALADVGDEVVPYLRYQPTYSARSAAACIRALRLINSPAAKACLKDYLAETRQFVLEELGQAVNPLEIKVVQEAFLRGDHIPVGREQIADLSPLAALTSLQSLNLAGTQVADLSPLAALTSLQSLDLRHTQVADLTPLASLASLQSLALFGTQVADLTPLASLTSLQELNLTCTRVADLTPLAALISLQSLDLLGTRVVDLTPLASLTSLQSLDLRGAQVADLSPLASLTSLRSLVLASSQVADLTPLAALTSLQSLDLASSQVADLTPLAALTSLQDLNLTGTRVADLSPLAALTSLQSLGLSDTQVADLLPLASLTSLEVLDLKGTQVTDLSPLDALQGLEIFR